MTAPLPRWRGSWFDGKQAGAIAVWVTLGPEGLQLQRPGQPPLAWPYAGITQTQGANAGEHVRLERGDAPVEVLVVADPGFIEALRAAAPDAGFAAGLRGRHYAAWVAGLAVGTAALGMAWFMVGLPWLTDYAARHVPLAAEESLGKLVQEQIVPEDQRLSDAYRLKAIDSVVQRLIQGRGAPYTFRVVLSDDDAVNAFAAPGGYLVVNRGLLQKTARAEELAGVLAHEVQHVLHRHATRNILRQLSTQALFAVITGDAGTMGQVASMAGQLGALSFQRADEAEADRDGMAMVRQAGIDPAGTVRMFEILQAEGQDGPTFLATHPAMDDRLATLRKLAGPPGKRHPALLPDVDWHRVAHGPHQEAK